MLNHLLSLPLFLSSYYETLSWFHFSRSLSNEKYCYSRKRIFVEMFIWMLLTILRTVQCSNIKKVEHAVRCSRLVFLIQTQKRHITFRRQFLLKRYCFECHIICKIYENFLILLSLYCVSCCYCRAL